ncbi:MAG TPA: gamma-glutamyltransferase, partial [Cyclobacteriaceae bacterium]|nr:gamma-glutamyltransferase [Cyclobacteriaceae bacterium]
MNPLNRPVFSIKYVWKASFLIMLLVWADSGYAQHGRTPVQATKGMVVSEHFLASQVGNEILKQGGNAVDATVATALALAVTYPSAGNIGGGGFMLYHGADGHKTSFNFREKAPLAAETEMFLDENGNLQENRRREFPSAVGVPGTVSGLFLAHQKLGSLPWADLVEPAIRLAEEGFEVTWNLQRFLYFLEENRETYPSSAKAFLKNGKEVIGVGDILQQPDLAMTLRRIQRDGADGFYKGETARLFVEFMQKNGGLIDYKDLETYEAQELPPIEGQYRGYGIYGMPPPSSGGVTLVEMLNILEGFDLAKMGHNSSMYLHVLTEAMRRAYADRALNL